MQALETELRQKQQAAEREATQRAKQAQHERDTARVAAQAAQQAAREQARQEAEQQEISQARTDRGGVQKWETDFDRRQREAREIAEGRELRDYKSGSKKPKTPKPPKPPTPPEVLAQRIAAYEQWRDSRTLPPGMFIEEKPGWDRDRAEPVTEILIGFKGETDPRKKMHIQYDVRGDIQYVRYLDGDDLYNRKAGIGSLEDLGLE